MLMLEVKYYFLTISVTVMKIKSSIKVHMKLISAILSDPNLAILMTVM